MQKSLIFKDNKDKSFVYRWINKVNNKEYLGSTANAKRRLLKYYDLSSLNLVSMPIYKAILKHGHSNFIFAGGRSGRSRSDLRLARDAPRKSLNIVNQIRYLKENNII